MRLKNKPKSEEYDPRLCAAARCTEPSEVIDASKRYWKEKVPLCDRHWADRCNKGDKS